MKKRFSILGAQMVETKKLYDLCKSSKEGHELEDATWKGRDNVTHYQDRCNKCGVYFDKDPS